MDTSSPSGLLLLTNWFLRGRFQECLEAIEKSKINTSNVRILQAGCWSNLGVNHEQADHQLREIIEKEPSNVFAHYGLGINFYLSGELEKSILLFSQAIEMSPSTMKKAIDYKNRAEKVLKLMREATTEFSNGNFCNAVKTIGLAPSIDPDNKSIKRIVQETTNSLMASLIAALETELFDEVDVKLNQTEYLVRANRIEDASKVMPVVKTARSWYVQGLISYYSGSIRLSAAHFAKAFEEDSTLAESQEMLQKATKLIELIDGASEKMAMKENAEAVELLSNALNVDETNKRIVQAIFFQRAMCKYNQGQIREAFEDYQKFEALQNETGLIMNGIKF